MTPDGDRTARVGLQTPFRMAFPLHPPARLATPGSRLLLALALASPLALPELPARAQAQQFLLGPGSNVGPATKVVPVNCRKNPDGSTTCDTKLENDPSDTPAKPSIDVFKN